MAEDIMNVAESDFDEVVLKSELPVLVDFWAVWCGPCKMIAPFVENIAAAYADKLKVVKLNVDESMSISSKFGIMSIPTLLLFKGGEVKETIVGALPQAKIEEKIKSHL